MGMAEYIEREATVELLRNLGRRDYRREKGTIQEAIKMVSFSEYTPAADVSPVRHGHWELTGADKYGRGGIWKCTGRDGCGKSYPYKCDFCPNCGAKMDKEDEA